MKKFTPTLLGLVVASAAFGQSQVESRPAQLEKADVETLVRVAPGTNDYRGAETTTLWSEDFASGIPATWTNQGFDGTGQPLTAAVWEYRGTSTTPDNATGSQGAYASANDPILSTTASNGFIIFDSDYLDNDGIAGNFGGGPAPAPHMGVLTTPSIDFSAEANVMLEFESYARQFVSLFQVTFSNDGGATWVDTVTVHSGVGVNSATSNASLVQINASSSIGGQANAKIRIIFDGTTGAAGSTGYYFWMIDDMRVTSLPDHSLTFVEDPATGAPARDIIYGTASGEGKFGVLPLKQTRPISFDCNVLNFGAATQTNVQLDVTVLDASNNTTVATVSSPVVASLASGAVADFTQLNTPSWTPSANGTYDVVWTVSSDSASVSDTNTVYVTDSLMSLDANSFDNRIGTPQLGHDGSAIATRFDLTNDERLFGALVGLSSTTVPGGTVEVLVYDSADFMAAGNFDNATPYGYYTGNITQTDVDNGEFRADFTDANGIPVYLSTSSTQAYYIAVYMYSNGGANAINLRNDQTFVQPNLSSLMYDADDSNWYIGYSNSLSMNAPWIRAVVCPASDAAACMSIGIEEVELAESLKVFPNPASEYVFVEFGEGLNGSVDINVIDLQGRTVISTTETAVEGSEVSVNLSALTPGVYMMNISKGETVSTFKLTVK